jgi:hypothetical protein
MWNYNINDQKHEFNSANAYMNIQLEFQKNIFII